jgi:DnaK suppressor protein
MNLEHARELLLAAKTEVEFRLERTHAHTHGRKEPVSPNFHEQVVETANDAVVQQLEQDAEEELQQIRKALQRIDSGDYYWCSKCGARIGAERLTALPWTAFCVKCA